MGIQKYCLFFLEKYTVSVLFDWKKNLMRNSKFPPQNFVKNFDNIHRIKFLLRCWFEKSEEWLWNFLIRNENLDGGFHFSENQFVQMNSPLLLQLKSLFFEQISTLFSNYNFRCFTFFLSSYFPEVLNSHINYDSKFGKKIYEVN